MSDIKHDIPDILVTILPDIQYITDITPSEIYQVDVNVGDIYSVNVNNPDIIVTEGSSSVYDLAQLAGYALYAGTSSFALTASYVVGDAGVTDWTEITNKPSGLVSSSQQALGWTVTSASYALTASYVSGAASQWKDISNKPTGLVSSSQQVQLNQITGTTFSSSNFTFPQNLNVNGEIWVTPGVINELTSSYAIKAENIGIIDAGTYQTGSEPPVSPTSGITYVTSASYALTSSYALNAGATSSYALTASYAMNGGTGGGLTSSLLSVDTYYFVGDGSTTNYILSKTYNNDSLIVTVGGVTFISPNDYSIGTNEIIFLDPPYSGSNIFVKGFVNVTNNVTGSFSGSFIGIATTASYVSDIVLRSTAPVTPKTGSVYFNESYLYIYDGTQYRSASLN